MATPKRKPTPQRKTTAKAAPRKAAAPKKKTTAVKTKVAPKTVSRTPVRPSQVGSKAVFEGRVNPNKPTNTIDPESFLGIIKPLKAAFGKEKITILDVPWTERDVARVMGGEWIDKLKAFVYKGEGIPDVLKQYATKDFSYWRWVEDQLNGRIKPHEAPLSKPFVLKPHQREAVDAIANMSKAGWRGFLQSDAPGVGKTLAGLVGASEAARGKGFTASKKARMLVVCPNGAIAHWRNTIRHAGIDNLRILVINYESYKKLLTVPKAATTVKKTRTKNQHIVKSGKPYFYWDYIICDESHKIGNSDSQRSQAFERIAQYSLEAKHAPFVIWMSATAGQTPLALSYLCPIIGQATKQTLTMETWPVWLKNNGFHVEKKKSGWEWVKVSGPDDAINRARQREDVERLAKIIFNPKAPSIRRLPEDIAGWPSVTRMSVPVQLSDDSKKQYDKLWTQFRKEMKLSPHGKDPSSSLVKMLRFSQKSSLLRTSQTVDNINDLLDNGYQVAVSVRFIETLETIKSALKKQGITASEFSGRTFIDNEKERMLFQKGINKVMLFTVEEAVSFHSKEQLSDGSTASSAPRAMLIHDIRFSALSITQIIGRTHRDGQKSNAYFLYGEDTIEEKILNIMLNKLQNMTILSGDDEESATVEILNSIIV